MPMDRKTVTTLAEDIRAAQALDDTASELASKAADAKAASDEAWFNLRNRMEDEGAESMRVDGTNYTPAQTDYCKIQDKQVFVEWAVENAPELIAPEPRKKLINERMRQYLDSGQALPPGIDFFPRQYISKRQA